jgi:hypothetical protein
MIHDSSFPDPFDARLFGHSNGGAVWILTHYFRYCHPDHPIITVPTGTLTDGASIPRCFHNIMGPHGPWFKAAVIHDFLYSPQSCHHYPGITRTMADQIFLQAMEDCGVGWITRRTIYRAVRMFGWIPYKKGKP